MNLIRYILASREDFKAICEIGIDLFDHDIKEDRLTEFLNDSRHHMIIAYHDDNIVGMASGFHYIHPDKDPQMFINEVGVVDEYQNRGIGRELVRSLCAHAKTLKCTEAWIGTEQSNEPARKCYLAADGIEDEEPFVLINFEIATD